MKILRVMVVEGPGTGGCHEASLPAVLGRGRGADIDLLDDAQSPSLSRRHLEVFFQGGAIQARDLSRNGTRIGERSLPQGVAVRITPGTELRLGARHTVRLEMVPEPEATPSVPRALPTCEDLQDRKALRCAWKRVALNRGTWGSDRVSIEEFAENLDRELDSLTCLLRSGRYEPLPARIVAVPKRSGGCRRLAILTVRDRVLQQALAAVLQPVFEPCFSPCSFAYRPGRSAHDAVRNLEGFLQAGLTWAVDADIEAFFDSVRHPTLLPMLAPAFGDQALADLVGRLLVAGQSAPGMGLAQGAATSPLYANIYLTPFDRFVEEAGDGLVRYADDWVALCATREEAERRLGACEAFLRGRLGLNLRPDKTRVASLATGFSFLGFRFDQQGRAPDGEAVARLRMRLAALPRGTETEGGRLVSGWARYFIPKVRCGEPPAAAVQGQESPAADLLAEPLGLSDLARLVALFSGRPDVHAVQWAGPGPRHGYLPRQEPLTPGALAMHLAGEVTLGAYLVIGGDRVRCLVLDVDAPRAVEPSPESRVLAWDLAGEARRWGLSAMVEESGGKGLHVWVFFSAEVPAASARRLGRLLAARVGGPRKKVSLEIFPREDRTQGLGSLVKLPWGRHRVSGRPSVFLDSEGRGLGPAEFLRQVRPISPAALTRTLQRLERACPAGHPEEAEPAGPSLKGVSDPIARVLAGCGLLRRLVDRPLKTGHLAHVERLALLYTLGHLGEQGRSYLHQVMARCDNYNPSITQRWIDRLEQGRGPLGCARLREWLSEVEGPLRCSCQDLPGPYRSPVFLGKPAPAEARPAAQRSKPRLAPVPAQDDAAWKLVFRDLFEEE